MFSGLFLAGFAGSKSARGDNNGSSTGNPVGRRRCRAHHRDPRHLAYQTASHFLALAGGELDLKVLGIYMAQHAKYFRYGLQAFGHLYARGAADVRRMLVENMAEEEGLIGGHSDHGAHDHMGMIHEFSELFGMTRDQVSDVEMTPGWWARARTIR